MVVGSFLYIMTRSISLQPTFTGSRTAAIIAFFAPVSCTRQARLLHQGEFMPPSVFKIATPSFHGVPVLH